MEIIMNDHPTSLFPVVENLTRDIASFVVNTTYADIPASVIEAGKKSILDGLGLALAGSAAKSGEIVKHYLGTLGFSNDGPATVIGTSLRTAVRFAAFANAVGIHADDFDDTQLAVGKDRVYGLLTHPTAPVLPSALAVGEALRCSGAELMLAYHLGVEVECKIAEAIAPRHYQHGFHATGTCGTFGSASAAAKLKNFDLDQTLRALSIAGSQSAGLRENFGTMTKPFHAGRASESGVVAAEFSALGWTATDKILEAPRGFFRAAGGGYSPDAIVGQLGDPWTFYFPGISIKPHPSGSLTHPGMTEMLRLIRENNLKAEDVERVDVGTNHNMPNALIHHRPQNELQAKFSMEFCIAILLLEGKAGLPEFTDEVVHRSDVKAMIERINFWVHPDAEAAGYDKMTTIIDIHLKDGRLISGRSDFGKGSPAHPMTYEEVSEKFLGCAVAAKWPEPLANAIINQVRQLETLDNVTDLTKLCAPH
jgi:2-methylcitrate dehydratase PrpD